MSSPASADGAVLRTARIQSDSTKPSKPQSSFRMSVSRWRVLGAVLAVHLVVGAHHRPDAGVDRALEVRQVDLAQGALVDGHVHR